MRMIYGQVTPTTIKLSWAASASWQLMDVATVVRQISIVRVHRLLVIGHINSLQWWWWWPTVAVIPLTELLYFVFGIVCLPSRLYFTDFTPPQCNRPFCRIRNICQSTRNSVTWIWNNIDMTRSFAIACFLLVVWDNCVVHDINWISFRKSNFFADNRLM